jgi:hypothetical protein
MNKNHTEISSTLLFSDLSQLFCKKCDKCAEINTLSTKIKKSKAIPLQVYGAQRVLGG